VTGTLTGVPATATAVVVSATAAHGTAASFLTVYPAGAASVPAVSNVNFSAGEAVANRVTVPVGTGGQIEVYNHSGTVDVDIDVDGYYTGVGGTGSAFVPITTPVRITDTRGATPLNGTPIAANTSESFNLATVASTIPATATSVAANFTVISGDASGYLSIYPASTTVHPVSSSINWTANETVPTFTIADTAGTGSVEVYNSAGGTINLLIDVFGYFEPVSNGPIMESAVVTHTSIAITYNETIVCPTLAGAQAEFAYDWTGAATGITSPITSVACATDVLTLSGALTTFTLPGSTGGTIIYTAPAINGAVSVSATGPIYAATQTLAVSGAVAPKIVSAYATATSIVITYNEDVTCTTGAAASLFSYVWTGIATDTITGCNVGAAGSDQLTLTSGHIDPPGTGASLTYTAPAAGNTPATAVYATGSNPDLYAATQTISGSAFTIPAITGATVNALAGTIAVAYSELPMGCPANPAVQLVFEYTNGGTPAYPSTCVASGTGVTLGLFMTTTTGTTAATLVLPGATDNLVYTSPATPLATNTVYATLDFPQFPATQTFALTATAAVAMTVPAVFTYSPTAITIGYTANVACPATGADGDFVYDSAFNTLGGAITGCSAVNQTLTLTGVFNPNTGAGSIVYTAPATSTTANAVYAANSTSGFAATQTLFPL
jgi:hypothetical protein